VERVLEPREHTARIVFGAREAAQLAGHGGNAVGIEVVRLATHVEFSPELVELHRLDVDAELAKGVQVTMPHPGPVHELDTELERGRGLR